MGGFFSPKTPAPAPAPPPAAEDPDAKDRERRLEALERRRRGRAGLVRTSERGLLNETASGAGAGKTLLGD